MAFPFFAKRAVYLNAQILGGHLYFYLVSERGKEKDPDSCIIYFHAAPRFASLPFST